MLVQGFVNPAALEFFVWPLGLQKLVNVALGWQVKTTVVFQGLFDPFIVAISLISVLLMILLEQAGFLKGWVRLMLKFQEATDNLANVSDVVTVLLLVEFEFVLEEMMLLLEDCDTGQSVG